MERGHGRLKTLAEWRSGGYERFLETMSDKSHPEHAETKKWCGCHFDPDWFDLVLIISLLHGPIPGPASNTFSNNATG